MKGKWSAVVIGFFVLLAAGAAADAPYEDHIYQVEDDVSLLEIVQVRLPSELPFIIDPYELAERGSVYSKPYPVKNNSPDAVRILVQGARCSTPNGDVRFSLEPVDRREALPEKLIHLVLTGPGEQSRILSEEASEPMSFILESGETAILNLTGSVSLPIEGSWLQGDVHVSMNFLIESIPVFEVPLTEPEELGVDAEEPAQPEDTAASGLLPDDTGEPDTGAAPEALPDEPPLGESVSESSEPPTETSAPESGETLPETETASTEAVALPEDPGAVSAPEESPAAQDTPGESSAPAAESEAAKE